MNTVLIVLIIAVAVAALWYYYTNLSIITAPPSPAPAALQSAPYRSSSGPKAFPPSGAYRTSTGYANTYQQSDRMRYAQLPSVY